MILSRSFPGFQAKFVELMCIRSESAEATESAVDAVVDVVKELEMVAPSKQVYSDLCLLLTTNKLSGLHAFKLFFFLTDAPGKKAIAFVPGPTSQWEPFNQHTLLFVSEAGASPEAHLTVRRL
jgi:hypothetical protein